MIVNVYSVQYSRDSLLEIGVKIYPSDHANFEVLRKRYGLNVDTGITAIASKVGTWRNCDGDLQNGGVFVEHENEGTFNELCAFSPLKAAYEAWRAIYSEYTNKVPANFERRFSSGIQCTESTIERSFMKRRDNMIVRIHVPNEADYYLKVTKYGVWLADIDGAIYRDQLQDVHHKMLFDLQLCSNLIERSTENDNGYRGGYSAN